MKVTQMMYVRAEELHTWNHETGAYECNSCYYSGHNVDMTDSGWIMVSREKLPVTFEVPDDFNMHASKTDALQAEKKAIEAEFQARLTEINARINRHLALTAPMTENGMEILSAVDEGDIPF